MALKKLLLTCLLASALTPCFLSAAVIQNPDDVIHWSAGAFLQYPDKTIEVCLQLSTSDDFSLYATKLKFLSLSPDFMVDGANLPQTKTSVDPLTGKETQVLAGGEFMVYLKPSLDANLDTPPKEISIAIEFTGCSQSICLAPHQVTLSSKVIPVNSNTPSYSKMIGSAALTVPNDQTIEAGLASSLSSGKNSLIILIAMVFLGGLLTNLTPCVAPMIPITLRLLGKPTGLPPFLNSGAYGLGIMVTYTALAVMAVLSGTAFGSFMSNPFINIAFAAVMAMMGLSMLGFGDLSWLQNIGNRWGSGKPSLRTTFLMGASAGLVAAPCTGPVLGALLAYTASRQSPVEGFGLMMSYSLGFALPYVFLGGVAHHGTNKFRISARFQILTKLIFAGVMFGLSFYYLRIPAYGLIVTLKSLWPLLASISLSIGGAVILAVVMRAQLRDHKWLQVAACATLGLGIFSAWQASAVLDAATAQNINVDWYHDREAAFAAARIENKPILIDNWAEWCEACKKMDVTTFADEHVRRELQKHWIVLKMDLTEGDEADEKHSAEFELMGLPTLIVLPPSGDVAAKKQIVGYVSASQLLSQLKDYRADLNVSSHDIHP